MEKFNYTAQDAEGAFTAGVLEAEDEESAARSLQERRLTICALQSARPRSRGILSLLRPGTGGNISGREMVFFGEQMATLLGGGISLVRALSLLSEQPDNKNLGVVLTAVTRDVSSGMALHKAFEKHPKVFDELWVSLVQAGELSGQLPAVLRQITSYCESRENIKSKILTALAYPAGLMAVSLCVLAYFVVFIVPVFADIFLDFKLKLPLITMLVVGVSKLLTTHLPLLLVASLGGGLAFRAYIATPPGRLTLNHIQLNLPLFGGLIRSMQLECLFSTMSMLMSSGVSILMLLGVLKNVFSKNLIFQSALDKAMGNITSGRSISESFRKTEVFPSMVTEMMRMGEESGKLSDSILVLSKYYKERIDQFIRRFAAIIDPILVLGIGVIVGIIVMSIFMPIFKLSEIRA